MSLNTRMALLAALLCTRAGGAAADAVRPAAGTSMHTMKMMGGPAGGAPEQSNARAASLLGGVGVTTVAGSDPYASGLSFPANTPIAGPFEAGFDERIDTLLTWLGCVPASAGYMAGGVDTQVGCLLPVVSRQPRSS
jgi:hypothetical protein